MTAARYCDRCKVYREPDHPHEATLWDTVSAHLGDIYRSSDDVFDAKEGERRREASIAQVRDNAEPDLKAELLESVRRVAGIRSTLTSDDVWQDFRARITDAPHEPRLLGAVMREAVRNAWIEATQDFELSKRPETHRNPKRVWRSLLREGAA